MEEIKEIKVKDYYTINEVIDIALVSIFTKEIIN